VVFVLFFIFFTTYFILANDHIVTVYFNPIHFNAEFYGTSSEFILPVWKLSVIAFLFGSCVMYVICQIKFYKQSTHIENLAKENAGLKNKFEKVKTDVSKCVI
jgi:hypothetical protein